MGSSTWVITPRHSILSRCSLTFGCKVRGHFLGGMYHEMNIMSELDLVVTRESTNSCELIWELLYQVISGPDGLGCCVDCSRLDLCCCGGSSAGFGGFVLGCRTVTTQFIFTIASLLHDGRPRMAGLGVSATYQYEVILQGQMPGPPGCHMMGPWSAPYRSIWDPL